MLSTGPVDKPTMRDRRAGTGKKPLAEGGKNPQTETEKVPRQRQELGRAKQWV